MVTRSNVEMGLGVGEEQGWGRSGKKHLHQ